MVKEPHLMQAIFPGFFRRNQSRSFRVSITNIENMDCVFKSKIMFVGLITWKQLLLIAPIKSQLGITRQYSYYGDSSR